MGDDVKPSARAKTLNEYQAEALRSFPPDAGGFRSELAMAALGVAGEAGEFADSVKKFLYQGKRFDADELRKELGDVLWYVAVAAFILEVSIEDVASENIEKLRRRYPHGFVPGSGKRE